MGHGFTKTNSLGQIHCDDGPAVVRSDYRYWCRNGAYHRLDGPAVVYETGYKEWWVNGKRIFCKTQEEFEKVLKLKAFL